MSYILDALKKSDQERQKNAAPSLQSIHTPSIAKSSSSGWRIIAVAMVTITCCIALAGVIYFFFPGLSNALSVQHSGDANSVGSVTQANEPVAQTGETLKSAVADESPVAVNAGKEATVVAADSPVVQLWELPDPVQQQIPAMTFSFHVYSENADRRTIIINNRRVKQGDSVAVNLLLEEITEKGVILNWKGRHRFVIDVVDNW